MCGERANNALDKICDLTCALAVSTCGIYGVKFVISQTFCSMMKARVRLALLLFSGVLTLFLVIFVMDEKSNDVNVKVSVCLYLQLKDSDVYEIASFFLLNSIKC